MNKSININDFDYPLPDERIAKFPLERRDGSKLLVYRNGVISERCFADIGDQLPTDTLFVFNNTKVVRARLVMRVWRSFVLSRTLRQIMSAPLQLRASAVGAALSAI